MNHLTPLTITPEARFQARKADDRAAIAALIRELVDLDQEIASERFNASFYKRNMIEAAWLRATVAASKVFIDVDFSEQIEVHCGELGIDSDGFPLDDEGFPMPESDHRFVDRVMPL